MSRGSQMRDDGGGSGSSLELVFAPAIALLNRLRYAPKFLLIGAVLLVPFFVVAYLQYDIARERVDFNSKEHIGVEYITPVHRLLGQVIRQRVLWGGVFTGYANARKLLDESRNATDTIIAEVDALDARYGGPADLRTTARWKTIRDQWATLKGQSFNSADQAESAYADMVGSLNKLILDDAGNYSNLILDPDLNSYWLMDVFLIKLPTLADTVSRASTRAWIPGQQDERFIELAGLYKLSSSTVSDMGSINLETAYKDDKERTGTNDLRTAIAAPYTEIKARMDEHAESIRKHYLSRDLQSSQATDRQVLEVTLQTVNENFKFYDLVGPALDQIIVKRVKQYEAKRTLGLLLSGLTALLLIYIFFALYLSVRRSVLELGRATGRMIQGTSETFKLESEDELGQIATSYNQINAALVESRTLQKKVAEENAELQENIMDMLRVVADASDGDLRVRAKVTAGALGNVADAFNSLMESLQNLIGEVQKQVARTNQSVAAISTSAREMAQGATRQAKEVEQATQFVQRMSSEIEAVATNAESAASAAKRTESSALEGSKAVDYVVSGMDSLRSNVQAGAKKVKNLGDRSMEVTSIVGTINRISEQTNMLALNAAIEAARAGEHGRGFSVVAEEVRKLAERTATATEEIDKLVKAIHQETNETVSAIEQQTQVVEQESSAVVRAGESLARIRDVSTESAELVQNISGIARSQVDGTRQVVNKMGQINAIAQATQSGADGTVKTVKELIALSEQLASGIRRFKVS